MQYEIQGGILPNGTGTSLSKTLAADAVNYMCDNKLARKVRWHQQEGTEISKFGTFLLRVRRLRF